ncbi:Hypp8536 [Branchiostoma lanceolatum]|uniref:Hypp8536 protein n=1 Tax=Branchiostoma lanceolatum TaxID=7740 RepID=A0A8J9Z8N6_BRALA|nr:Hypp8536 [Branchiostoma lanceolatum]
MAVHARNQAVIDYLVKAKAAERKKRLQAIRKKAEEGGRQKRDSPSVEKEEDSVTSQQTETPVELEVFFEEGAVGGFEQVLVIKDEDGLTNFTREGKSFPTTPPTPLLQDLSTSQGRGSHFPPPRPLHYYRTYQLHKGGEVISHHPAHPITTGLTNFTREGKSFPTTPPTPLLHDLPTSLGRGSHFPPPRPPHYYRTYQLHKGGEVISHHPAHSITTELTNFTREGKSFPTTPPTPLLQDLPTSQGRGSHFPPPRPLHYYRTYQLHKGGEVILREGKSFPTTPPTPLLQDLPTSQGRGSHFKGGEVISHHPAHPITTGLTNFTREGKSFPTTPPTPLLQDLPTSQGRGSHFPPPRPPHYYRTYQLHKGGEVISHHPAHPITTGLTNFTREGKSFPTTPPTPLLQDLPTSQGRGSHFPPPRPPHYYRTYQLHKGGEVISHHPAHLITTGLTNFTGLGF